MRLPPIWGDFRSSPARWIFEEAGQARSLEPSGRAFLGEIRKSEKSHKLGMEILIDSACFFVFLFWSIFCSHWNPFLPTPHNIEAEETPKCVTNISQWGIVVPVLEAKQRTEFAVS